MEPSGNKLSKIRTFRDDLERTNPDIATVNKTVTTKPQPVTVPKPEVKLPPVLLPKKPLPPTPARQVVPLTQNPAQGSQTPIIPAVSRSLSEEVDTLTPITPVNTERLSVLDAEDAVSEGTIITDQKRKRFRLLPAMATAINDWFAEGKEAIENRVEKKRQATPTIRTLEERKTVIEKAARQSALAPRDDHKQLAQKLPTIPKRADPAGSTVVIKKKDPNQKPTWSHFEGQEPPKAPIIEISPQTNSNSYVPSGQTPVIPPVPIKQHDVSEPSPARPIARTEPQIVPTQPSAPAAAASPEVAADRKPAISNETKPVTNERPYKPTPRPAFQIPKFVGYALVLLVAGGAAGGGTLLTLWFFTDYQSGGMIPTTVTETGVVDQSLFRNDASIRHLLPRQRAMVYDLIEEQSDSGITRIIFTVQEQTGERQANTNELLSVLSWRASAPLLRAIDTLEFGTSAQGPFVVMRVTSFDTAFGGLLAAEENLSEDLQPLFGERVTGTFDPQDEPPQTREPFFVDDVVQNHDVRVLRDEMQKERLVYGFVNQNTVIIAPDREVFRATANAVR